MIVTLAQFLTVVLGVRLDDPVLLIGGGGEGRVRPLVFVRVPTVDVVVVVGLLVRRRVTLPFLVRGVLGSILQNSISDERFSDQPLKKQMCLFGTMKNNLAF
jgi:hypothetical protein